MSGTQGPAIVVGVDGTPASRAALVFALEEGARRGSAVEVVTTWAFAGPYDGSLSAQSVRQARDNAERVQDEAVSAALNQVEPAPVVSRSVIEGAAGQILVNAARHAGYLVVGSAHKSMVRRAVLGSVSHYCVSHATVPVVVVPPPSRPEGPQAPRAVTVQV